MKKTIHLVIVSICFSYLLIFFGCDNKTKYSYQDSSTDLNYKTYEFSTRNVSGFRELADGDRYPNYKGFGHLYLPPNASSKNKVPLINPHWDSGSCIWNRVAHYAASSQNYP